LSIDDLIALTVVWEYLKIGRCPTWCGTHKAFLVRRGTIEHALLLFTWEGSLLGTGLQKRPVQFGLESHPGSRYNSAKHSWTGGWLCLPISRPSICRQNSALSRPARTRRRSPAWKRCCASCPSIRGPTSYRPISSGGCRS